MIRVDTRALLALYDRRLDLASGINAAHAEDAAVGGVNAVARVEALLADGQFRATVANQVLNLNLPPGTRVGDQVPVRLVDGNWVPAATSANPVKAPVGVATVPPAAGEEAVTARLSPAVRLLAELLQQSGSPALRPALSRPALLLAQPPQDASALAQAIRGAIGESGLFYEAHQAQWLFGARSLAQLRTEPQGQLAPLPPLAPLAASPAPAATAARAAGPATIAEAQAPVNLAPAPQGDALTEYRSVAAMGNLPTESETGLATAEALETELSASASKASEATPRPSGPNVHPEALPLVRQQLDVLEQPVLAWRGEFWPGQPGEIELREDREASAEPGAERVFATRLTLDLPRLGSVEAMLQITGKHLQVRLRGESGGSETEMGARLAELGAALSALGLDLDELRVLHGQV